MTVDKGRVELWCQAMESGRYKQGKSRLRTAAGYCCLGVACDVANPNGWGSTWSHQGSYNYMSSGVMKWYGFNTPNPTVYVSCPRVSEFHTGPECVDCGGTDVTPRHLSSLNDKHSFSFAEIAAAVRRTYPEEGSNGDG